MPSARHDPTPAELEEIYLDNLAYREELRVALDELGPRQARELAEYERGLRELRQQHREERLDLEEQIERVEAAVAKKPKRH